MAAAASVLLLVVAIGEAGSQTTSNPEPKTPAEAARAIANPIDADVPKTPDMPPIAIEYATSRDNIVEVHYTVKDARFFPHNKAEGDDRRLRLAPYFCVDRRLSLFRKNGVVIHLVLAAPDNSDPFEFTIDQSTCAALIADVETRATVAEQKRFESTQPATWPNSPTEPKRVRTMTIRPDQAEQKRPESTQSANSLTEPERVHTINSLVEPKRVRTMTIRSDQAEQK